MANGLSTAALSSNFLTYRREIWSSNKTEIANETRLTTPEKPLDVVPDEIPFDVPYGLPISLDRAQAVIHAAMAEAKKRIWKMNVAVADSGGNLVAFQRMDGAMLASIQIAEHKAQAAATFRRPTKIFEDGIQLMRLNYLLAFDGIIASRGGIPLIDHGVIIGVIGSSGGTDSQDDVVSQAGAAVINQVPATTNNPDLEKAVKGNQPVYETNKYRGESNDDSEPTYETRTNSPDPTVVCLLACHNR
jgi:glc operon protein GlcG